MCAALLAVACSSPASRLDPAVGARADEDPWAGGGARADRAAAPGRKHAGGGDSDDGGDDLGGLQQILSKVA